MTNNELSRKVLGQTAAKPDGVRFDDLVANLGVDARAVFKNLFFLEERGLVQLSTRNSSDSVYPQILLVRLRNSGRRLIEDQDALDKTFPLSDTTSDLAPHIPPSVNGTEPPTFARVLELLSAKIREAELDAELKEDSIEKIESLLALPQAAHKVRFE